MLSIKSSSGMPLLKFAALLLGLVLFASACQDNPAVSPTITVDVTHRPQKTAAPTEFPPGFPTPDPGLYSDCLAKGGHWEVLGFSGPGCNLPTSDGGKACRDSQDCESACLADPDLVNVAPGNHILLQKKIDQLNSQKGEKIGVCSPWKENFGCQVWLQDGSFVEMCVD